MIYPNPVDKILTIELLDLNIPTQIELYNLQGQILLQQVVTNKKTNIDLSFFSSGVYFVEIIQENNRIRQKILKYVCHKKGLQAEFTIK